MAIKRKDFVPNTVLNAADVEMVQDNGVIQVDNVGELDVLPEDLVKLAYVKSTGDVYVYRQGAWKKFVGAGANPLGSMMAYGINGNPPAGWQICNGGAAQGPLAAIMTNVPNLINRTIVGIGTGHAYNTADGTASNTVGPTTTNHTHSFSGTVSNHTHSYSWGRPHEHVVYYRNATMKKAAGSSDPYVRFDATNNNQEVTNTRPSELVQSTTSNGATASGTTDGSSVISGNQVFDNYPPNRAFHWIIYNGSDV